MADFKFMKLNYHYDFFSSQFTANCQILPLKICLKAIIRPLKKSNKKIVLIILEIFIINFSVINQNKINNLQLKQPKLMTKEEILSNLTSLVGHICILVLSL